jgi:glycosyltransferase involved in cell wall biosynthesis
MGHNVKVITQQPAPGNRENFETREKQLDVYYEPGFRIALLLFFWCNILYMPNFSLKSAWFIPFRLFKKWIVSHNDLYLCNTKSIKCKTKLMLIKLVSHNISVSNYIAKNIDTSSKVIYNCFDNETFKIYEDEERKHEFVFLGRLVSQKGCELLIKACKNLKSPFTLNIIGDGPERGKLERMVKDLGLEKNINFLGILEGETLARVLNRHHVMVIPPIGEEGFGMVALEGMACGCKIIASNAGGLSEAVKGFGKMFEMGNQQELELLLEKELEALRHPIPTLQDLELKKYLEGQNKETVAGEYLKLFAL